MSTLNNNRPSLPSIAKEKNGILACILAFVCAAHSQKIFCRMNRLRAVAFCARDHLLLAIKVLLVGMALLVTSSCAINWNHIKQELIQMRKDDQDAIRSNGATPEKAQQVFKLHLARLKEIVKDTGWPTLEKVDFDGTQSAWLIVQHADFDVDFQREILEILKPLAAKGRVPKEHYAFLYDRVAKNDKLPQRYGSQGSCKGQGDWEPWQIENPEQLEVRRASMELQPMNEYRQKVSRFCK
ncbi:MAG: hypothetical protein IPP88_14510 [Betaproteobacteria bacterium]|nr:hypothetical protein [Betaproteobacteria bacterium]